MMRIVVNVPKVASSDRAVEKRKSPKKVVGMLVSAQPSAHAQTHTKFRMARRQWVENCHYPIGGNGRVDIW
jgi:hypothetical protein